MNSTAKKITKSGQITIPKQIRARAGMFPGGAVNIECTEDGAVILKTVVPCCSFCGSPDEVFDVLGTRVCKPCAQKIYEKARKKHDRP